MSLSLFLCGAAIFIQLILGIVVLVKDARKRANQLFSLQLFLFTLWNIAEINLIINGVSFTGIKLLITPGILLSFFFFVFSAIYPEYQKDSPVIRSKLNLFLFFLPAALLVWLLWSDQLIREFNPIHNGFTLSFGKFEFLMKGIIVGYLVLTLSTLSASRKKAETQIQMRRFRYTFTAMLLPVAAGSIIIAAGKWFIGGSTAYSYGLFPVLGIIMSMILGYTMLKYNLMEIDLIFSIGLVYTMLTAILAGCMELLQELMQNILNLSGMLSKILSVLAIAAVFSPLKDLLIKLVDKFFGRKSFDSARVMQHILTEMRKSQSMEKMLCRLASELELVLDFSYCRIQVEGINAVELAPKSHQINSRENFAIPEFSEDFNDIETLIDIFTKNENKEKLEQLLLMKEAGIRNIFLFTNGQKRYGALLLGPKTTKVPYTETELNLLYGICKEVPHLIENLKMLERLIIQDRSSHEIARARDMLNAISSTPEDFKFHNLSIATFASLSQTIKGDMIDCNDEAANSFIAVYDAFHHGIQAVLTLNIVFAVFRSLCNPDDKLKTAHKILRHYEKQTLCSAVTLISSKSEALEIFNSGNPSPILFSEGNAIRIFDSGSDPLGLETRLRYDKKNVLIQPNQLLLITTNGLEKAFIQLTNQSLEEFLAKTKFDSAKDCRNKIAEEIGIKTATGFSDDITFLVAGKI
ncbi:MAG: hypothetical protein Kow0029_07720 [Candidatus Rifleibacteriota bacterium]